MKKEAMKLNESGELYIVGFGGIKGKGEMYLL